MAEEDEEKVENKEAPGDERDGGIRIARTCVTEWDSHSRSLLSKAKGLKFSKSCFTSYQEEKKKKKSKRKVPDERQGIYLITYKSENTVPILSRT